MVGRLDRTIMKWRLRITLRTRCDTRQSPITLTAGVLDPTRSEPGSTASH
jgi:hypothetical protein